jgi:hypothetical protein
MLVQFENMLVKLGPLQLNKTYILNFKNLKIDMHVLNLKIKNITLQGENQYKRYGNFQRGKREFYNGMITVTAQPKARTVFASSNSGIVGSNPT